MTILTPEESKARNEKEGNLDEIITQIEGYIEAWKDTPPAHRDWMDAFHVLYNRIVTCMLLHIENDAVYAIDLGMMHLDKTNRSLYDEEEVSGEGLHYTRKTLKQDAEITGALFQDTLSELQRAKRILAGEEKLTEWLDGDQSPPLHFVVRLDQPVDERIWEKPKGGDSLYATFVAKKPE